MQNFLWKLPQSTGMSLRGFRQTGFSGPTVPLWLKALAMFEHWARATKEGEQEEKVSKKKRRARTDVRTDL